MKKRLLIFFSCWFFALGIALAYFLPKSFLVFDLLYFSVAIFLAVVAWFLWRKKHLGIGALWASFLFLGFWRLAISLPIDSTDKIWHYNGRQVVFIARVVEEPIDKAKSEKVKVESLFNQTDNLPISGAVLLSVPLYPKYNYGDILEIDAKLETPGMIEDFDYGKYLAAKNVYSLSGFPKIKILKAGELPAAAEENYRKVIRGEWFWNSVNVIRHKLRATIEGGLNEPEAGLLKAFVLGDAAAVPDDLNNSFRQSGLSHIVAISGTHITLLVGIIFYVFLGLNLRRRQAFYLSIPVIIFYIVLAGSPASAVRAGVMGFLVLLAMHVGRLNRLDYSLALAAAVMLLLNPKLLIADAGFQLSFLAVMGMIYLYPIFDKKALKFYDGRPVIVKIICQTVALTLAAQIFTAPILIFSFHQISLIAPLANLLVLWTSPFIMIGAFIAMGLSFFIPALAPLFFLSVGLLLKYMILAASLTAQLPFAYLKW